MKIRLLLLAQVILTGCTAYPRAQNPFPGVFRIAVVPFNNKTAGDVGLDTLALTKNFASELQRVPTFEVVPVQEVAEVMGPFRLDTNQPAAAYALARALHCQAIIVGDVTEFDAYYPPRIGLHCELYAMVPGEPQVVAAEPPYQRPAVNPRERGGLLGKLDHLLHGGHRHCKECAALAKEGRKCSKCQSAEATASSTPKAVNGATNPSTGEKPLIPSPQENIDRKIRPIAAQSYSSGDLPKDGVSVDPNGGADPKAPIPSPEAPFEVGPEVVVDGFNRSSVVKNGVAPPGQRAVAYQAGQANGYGISIVGLQHPQPVVEPWVVRHSRVFDMTNLGLVKKLRDYYFFHNDLRGGDWQGYTDRLDDFYRFTCNQMIYEMLLGAGGKWETLRGLKFPQPWQPWPWR